MSTSGTAHIEVGEMSKGGEVTFVRLCPYRETDEFYRTVDRYSADGVKTSKEQGGQRRWFEKSKVSVVSRDRDSIVLAMPREYADQRQGIESLRTDEGALGDASAKSTAIQNERPVPTLPDRIDLQVGPGGRVIIPAAFRDAIEAEEGDRLMARVVDGELRLITPEMAIRRAQKWVRETIPAGVSLVDDLIEMRRQEAADEFKDG